MCIQFITKEKLVKIESIEIFESEITDVRLIKSLYV